MYSNKDITIVINTFNSEDQIYSCLDKIESEVKVIIIENSNNHELKVKLEKKYPGLRTSTSPTQRIGGRPLDSFQKAKHKKRQWSLDDAFDFDQMKKWEERISKILQKCDGNKTHAAKKLGLNVRTLRNKIKEYQIEL